MSERDLSKKKDRKRHAKKINKNKNKTKKTEIVIWFEGRGRTFFSGAAARSSRKDHRPGKEGGREGERLIKIKRRRNK